MGSILRHFAFLLLIGFVLIACKKDANRVIAPNTIVETEPAIQKPVTVKIIDAIGGYYEALPVHYNETTKSYPLLVFIPGAGQYGNGGADLPVVLNDGVAKLIDKKKFPPNFNVKGENFSLIVLSPQFNYYPSNFDVATFINYARQNYRIDSTRIYMSGLSLGGFVTSDFSAENTSLIAAAVPISGVLLSGDVIERCEKIAHGKLPLWVFHNTDDPTINATEPMRFVSLINNDNPLIPAKITLFKAAIHDAWTQAIDPSYKENNINIYEWMLQYKK
ncbi:MAG: dienelactone hydrolase family protein [Chitinophagaceae bacterium]